MAALIVILVVLAFAFMLFGGNSRYGDYYDRYPRYYSPPPQYIIHPLSGYPAPNVPMEPNGYYMPVQLPFLPFIFLAGLIYFVFFFNNEEKNNRPQYEKDPKKSVYGEFERFDSDDHIALDEDNGSLKTWKNAPGSAIHEHPVNNDVQERPKNWALLLNIFKSRKDADDFCLQYPDQKIDIMHAENGDFWALSCFYKNRIGAENKLLEWKSRNEEWLNDKLILEIIDINNLKKLRK